MKLSNKQISKNLFSGEMILLGMPGLAYVFDEDGKLLLWNENVEKIMGYSKEELLNKPILDFVDTPFKEKIGKLFAGLLKHGGKILAEYDLRTKAGKIIPYLGNGVLTSINGQVFMIGQAINIEKLRSAEADLKRQITETNRLKDLLYSENLLLKEEIRHKHDQSRIIGESDSLLYVLDQIDKVAPFDTTVLLTGEARTGKELFARAIHDASKRKEKSFQIVNCNKYSEDDLETEIFGKTKNFFNKNDISQTGKLELANNGTLFLNNINTLPASIQNKLLLFLQTGEFKKTNDPNPVKVSVRLIAATNQNLDSMVQQKLFHRDLNFALKPFPIRLPALRERKSDIPRLTNYFINHFNEKYNKNVSKITKSNLEQLTQYNWPGNIKELKNEIERAVINSSATILKFDTEQTAKFMQDDKKLTLTEVEKNHILSILKITNWRVSGKSGAAKILAIHPETLRSRMRKLGIKRPVKKY